MKYRVVEFICASSGEEIKMNFITAPSNSIIIVCEEYCSYSKVCKSVNNPETNDGEFSTFCNKVDGFLRSKYSDVDPILHYPAEGELEKYLGTEFWKNILKKDPTFKLSEVIDSVCFFWCDKYDKEHTNCTKENPFCIMRKLFEK